MLPNFLIIGAAKAGTTAMWHILSQHPQIYMSPHKEPRYFALCSHPIDFRGPGDMTRFHFVTTFDDYVALFDGVKDEIAIGEASPWYLYVPSAAPAIKDTLPNVKLIAILREPVDRAFSNYLHARREGLEPIATFREAMEAEDDRIRANWSPRFHYKKKGFYSKQLTNFFRHFDADVIRVYLYEDLLEAPQELFHDLFQFLHVDSGFQAKIEHRVNVSWIPRSQKLAEILRDGNILTRTIGHRLPPIIREKFKAQIAALNEKKKPKISPEDREYFSNLYRDDISRLEDILGRNLDRWKTSGATG